MEISFVWIAWENTSHKCHEPNEKWNIITWWWLWDDTKNTILQKGRREQCTRKKILFGRMKTAMR